MEENCFKGTLILIVKSTTLYDERSFIHLIKSFKIVPSPKCMSISYVHCMYVQNKNLSWGAHKFMANLFGLNFHANDYEQVATHIYQSIELKLLFESI